jgi:two-component system chemotaxis sensor kinase CheA
MQCLEAGSNIETVPIIDKRKFTVSIRASLLLAFLAISGFVILASAAALQALLQVGAVLSDITEQRMPAMVASLDLSRQVERFVAAAQQLSVVETRDDYRDRSAELDIRPVFSALNQIHTDQAAPLHEIVVQLQVDLTKLDTVVVDRLTVSEQKSNALHKLLDTDLSFQYATRPLQRSAASDAIGLESSIAEPHGSLSLPTLMPRIQGLLSLNRMRRIEIAFARAHDLLLIGATAGSQPDLQLTTLAVTRALSELDKAAAEAPANLESALTEAAKLRPQLEAPDGVLALHKRELDDHLAAADLVSQIRADSRTLMNAVDALVQADRERVAQGTAEAASVRQASIVRLFVVIIGSLVCSALIVLLYVNRYIVVRLARVRDSMLALATGSLSDELPPAGADEIGRMAASLRIFRETAIERDERELAQARAEEKLKRTLADIANLLDSSGEGFLSFGIDLVIDPQCSRACVSLLGVHPAGRDAAQILFGEDPVKQDLLRDVVATIAKPKIGSTRRSMMLSLLPSHVARGGRLLEANYNVLDNGHLMVVLADITERDRLAATLTREHRQLSMVVAAVTESLDFFDAVQSFRRFLDEELPERLSSALPGQRLVQDLYRDIHTYKGVLGQFSFAATPDALHALEEKLAELVQREASPGLPEIAAVVDRGVLLQALEVDLDSLRSILGDAFVSGGARVSLTLEQATHLERLAARLLKGERPDLGVDSMILRNILHLRRDPVRHVMLGYDRMVADLAVRLEKPVMPLMVHGGEDIWIDPQRYGPFLRALVHVFRNAVAHGIEDPDRRIEAGKDENGRIRCIIGRAGSMMSLVISDDGGGIDIARLRQRAVEAGLFSQAQLAGMPDADICDLVFRDGISTKNTADQLSGRGIGLASVRAETEKLGGQVSVLSTPGQGTQFRFVLPIGESDIEIGAWSEQVAG